MPVTAAFALVAERPVPGLRLTARLYEHPSGARHIHLASDDGHRAFAVAFRTGPADSSGLPHILEHLALCGSSRYPVRDPFFMMLRRSLQTFMNAFTYPDLTAYPFATQVAKDFDNLLGIYLDAVFEPTLHPLDFAQEGWRLEPAEPGKPEGPWAFRGVVFNEMKGAMGESDQLLFQAAKEELLPDTCYRHNSGGDPLTIPSLAHADLVAYHQSRYGAANACFATYGAIDLAAVQERFSAYIDRHPGRPLGLPDLQPPLGEPRQCAVPVPLQAGQDPRDVSAIGLHWVWDDIADLDEVLIGELTDRLLFGHPAAPLRLALDSSHLGRSSGGSGYLAYLRNGLFSVELEGVAPTDYDRFEPLVLEALSQIAEQGFPSDEIDAALHQVELSRRRIGGDGMPFGLQLCLRGILAWNHGRDPLAAYDQDEAIARLAERAHQPGFWQDLIQRRLLDNPHRLLLQAEPDPDLARRNEERETALVAEHLDALDEPGRAAAIAQAERLAERQTSVDDLSCLPELALSDIPEQMRWAEEVVVEAGLRIYPAGTNGLVHGLCALPLPALEPAELDLLPLLGSTLGQLGVGERDYREQSQLLNRTCGDCHFWYQIGNRPDDRQRQRSFLFGEVRGLASRAEIFLGLLPESLRDQRFDEHERLRELLEEALNHLQGRLLGAGHEIASAAASRGLGGSGGLGHRLGGAERLAWLRAHLQAPDGIARIATGLTGLMAKLRQQPVSLALVGDTVSDAGLQRRFGRLWEGFQRRELDDDLQVLQLPGPQSAPPMALTMATPVNYCALALPAMPMTDPDSAAVAVACQYLKDQILHGRIREQGGAYGAMCHYRSQTGLITCASYRDPRLQETFTDMAEAFATLATIPADDEALTSAILGRIASIDSPSSPAGEARRRFSGGLTGYDADQVGAFRSRVLQVDCAAIRAVAERWFQSERATRAVLCSSESAAALDAAWEVCPLT